MKGKYTPLNWIQWMTLFLFATYAATTVLLFVQVQSVQHHQNDALHSIICFAEKRVAGSPILSANQKRHALAFYRQALIDAHLRPCP